MVKYLCEYVDIAGETPHVEILPFACDPDMVSMDFRPALLNMRRMFVPAVYPAVAD
jgi:hypothetical protein